ncbi:hypothetical protein BH11PSE3_BH11PSE3_17200 [soil metagenome]
MRSAAQVASGVALLVFAGVISGVFGEPGSGFTFQAKCGYGTGEEPA